MDIGTEVTALVTGKGVGKNLGYKGDIVYTICVEDSHLAFVTDKHIISHKETGDACKKST